MQGRLNAAGDLRLTILPLYLIIVGLLLVAVLHYVSDLLLDAFDNVLLPSEPLGQELWLHLGDSDGTLRGVLCSINM